MGVFFQKCYYNSFSEKKYDVKEKEKNIWSGSPGVYDFFLIDEQLLILLDDGIGQKEDSGRVKLVGESLENIKSYTYRYGFHIGIDYGIQIIRCVYCRFPYIRIYRKLIETPDICYSVCYRSFQDYFESWQSLGDDAIKKWKKEKRVKLLTDQLFYSDLIWIKNFDLPWPEFEGNLNLWQFLVDKEGDTDLYEQVFFNSKSEMIARIEMEKDLLRRSNLKFEIDYHCYRWKGFSDDALGGLSVPGVGISPCFGCCGIKELTSKEKRCYCELYESKRKKRRDILKNWKKKL